MNKMWRWCIAVSLSAILFCTSFSGVQIHAEEQEDLEAADSEAVTETEDSEDIEVEEETLSGLVIGGTEWNDEGVPVFANSEFAKHADLVAKNDSWLYSIGIASEDGIVPITIDNIGNFTITDSDGNPVLGAEVRPGEYWNSETNSDEAIDGIFLLYIETTGNYVLTYSDDDITDSLTISVALPIIGLYNSQEVSSDTLLGYHVSYSEKASIFYFNKNEIIEDGNSDTFEINSIRTGEEDEFWMDYLTFEDTENGVRMTITSGIQPYFSICLKGVRTVAWQDEDGNTNEDSWEDELWFDFAPDRDAFDEGHILCFDGGAVAGFCGNYISKDQFEHPERMGDFVAPGDNYLVHAPTIQDVINKLSEAAIGDSVTGYIDDPSGNQIPADNLNIVNTGYILIYASYTGDEYIEPQYVASSGNLKGIFYISGGMSPYNIKVDDTYVALTGKGTGEGEYIEMPAIDPYVILESMKDLLSDTEKRAIQAIADNEGAVVPYGDGIYPAVRNEVTYSNRDLGNETGVYYSLGSTESLVNGLTEDEIWDAIDSWVEETGHWEIRMQREQLIHGLHVNAYCDMTFQGNMGNLVIGYPSKELTDGAYHEITVLDSNLGESGEGYVVEGPDSFPKAVTVNNAWDKDLYSYSLRTYAIESDLNVDGNADNVKVVTPEPNALSELSYAQKDAIETGARMQVTVTANNIDADTAEDTEVQTAINAIQSEITEGSQLQYIDFTVDAFVEGVEGTTNITETEVPMNITFTPKDAYDRTAVYRIIRYHDEQIDYIDQVDSLYGEIAGLNMGFVINEDGSITFLTDRFLTYALEKIGGNAAAERTDADVTTESTTVDSSSDEANNNEGLKISPKTGDEAPVAAAGLLLLMSILCGIWLRSRRS
ncbi:MAG: hypothetical protein IJ079_07510 [Lachnospiraceae bacterium]|nr:hypothetical protein [Lachnospiraceae bacterium]